MHLPDNSNFNIANSQNLVCPNLLIHWQIISVFDSNQVFLQAIQQTEKKLLFSEIEGYALNTLTEH